MHVLDCKGTLYFTELIPELLTNGQTLELDRMGIFSVRLKSRGENSGG